MKIALIDPSLFTWPYDVHLAKGLEENGHQVAVFGRDPGRRLGVDEERYLRQHFYPGFETKFMGSLPQPLFLGLKGFSHIESMARLVFKLRKWRPDAIHFQWTPLAIVDKHFIGSFRRIAPTVLTAHDPSPFNDNPRSALQSYDAIGIMNLFDQLIVHTEKAKTKLISNSIAPNKINIVPHGLLMERTTPSTSNIQDSKPVTLLMFGQIKPYKGLDILIRAVAQLPLNVREKCRVLVVGRPQMPMEPLFALAEELGVKQYFEFNLHFIPDSEIRGLMDQADMLVFPYREIDASGVLMIAIPAGKAIVASKIGLFDELLKDGVHGALVKPDNPAALADALASLIDNPGRRLKASNAVSELAGVIPTWKEIANRTTNVYQRAVVNRR